MKSLIVFFLFVLAGVASAQVPRTISYQGLLTDAVSGNAIPDGNHSLTIKLYDVIVGGNHLYSETQVLPVVKGIFNFIIGSVTPLPATLLFDKQYFLGVSVDVGTELSPRSPLAAVPYAFEAGHATDADNAKESGSSKLADIAKEADHAKIADEAKNLASGATGVVKSVNNQSGVLTFQGSGGTTVTNVGNTITIGSTGGSGTGIQGVQSTDGSLAVTNPNGPVADLKIQLNSITSAYVKDGSLKAADFEAGTIPTSLPPNGAAGGDLSSTYPNPTVVKLNGVALGSTAATQGNILVANAGKWETTSMSGDATLSNTGALTLTNTTVSAGGYGSNTQVGTFTVDARGRLSAASNVTISGVSPGGSAGGDLSGTYPNPSAANTSVSAGSYGSNSQIATFTVDGKGRLTAASNVALAASIVGGAAGGDLSGTFPNPTVAKLKGASLGTTTATAGNLLIGSADSTTWVSNTVTGNVRISPTGVTTIADSAVSYAKMQPVSTTSKLLGSSATTTSVQEISLASGITMTGTSLTLGAITPTSVAATGAISGTTITGSSAISGTSLTTTNTSNQLVLGTTNKTTITSPAPAASQTYTIGDMGAAAVFALTTSAVSNTIPKWSGTNGKLTSSSITDDGTNISTGENLLLTTSGKRLSFKGTGTGTTTFEAGAQGATTINYVLPIALPSGSGALVSNSSGTLSIGSYKRVSAIAAQVQVINDAAVTATSTIIATTEGTLSYLTITARVAGTSFTVTSNVALVAADFINYQILP